MAASMSWLMCSTCLSCEGCLYPHSKAMPAPQTSRREAQTRHSLRLCAQLLSQQLRAETQRMPSQKSKFLGTVRVKGSVFVERRFCVLPLDGNKQPDHELGRWKKDPRSAQRPRGR